MYLVTDSTGKELGVFLHIPRTAGTYVRKCLDFVGLDTAMVRYAHFPLTGIRHSELFTFTFIRHPITWYPSMFAYSQEHGWDRDDSFPWSKDFRASTLLGFVKKTRKYYPEGYFYKLVERATVAPGKTINFVGRQEVLHMDLCIALAAMGVRAECREIQEGVPDKVNASKNLPAIDLPTARMIEEQEQEVIRRWY